MADEECYVVYNDQLFASSLNNPVPKALRKKRQLNIGLKLREVVILKTSDETPSRDDDQEQDMDVLNALKLCDDGLAEIVEDVTPPELFKSIDLSPHAYLQRFEFYKALSDMGFCGNFYTHLRDELVKKFEAFADSLCKNNGVTRACSFTANLFVVKVDFISSMNSSKYDRNNEVVEAVMSSIGSSNSGDRFIDKGGCNSSIEFVCLWVVMRRENNAPKYQCPLLLAFWMFAGIGNECSET